MIAPMTKPDQRGHRGRYVALVALLWAGAMCGAVVLDQRKSGLQRGARCGVQCRRPRPWRILHHLAGSRDRAVDLAEAALTSARPPLSSVVAEPRGRGFKAEISRSCAAGDHRKPKHGPEEPGYAVLGVGGVVLALAGLVLLAASVLNVRRMVVLGVHRRPGRRCPDSDRRANTPPIELCKSSPRRLLATRAPTRLPWSPFGLLAKLAIGLGAQGRAGLRPHVGLVAQQVIETLVLRNL